MVWEPYFKQVVSTKKVDGKFDIILNLPRKMIGGGHTTMGSPGKEFLLLEVAKVGYLGVNIL